MDWWEALVLGVVQGLTEFLPVSSSGHLQIFGALFGVNGDSHLTFAVVVHAATVCSTIVVFAPEIAALFRGCLRSRRGEEMQYVGKLALSMIPVGIVGLFFRERVEELFSTGLMLVGGMLLVTALLLAFACRARSRSREVGYKDAFLVGLAQAFAVLPGLSRSGATIATGLLLGIRRESVARFSFLMVLAPVLGEALLDLLKGGFASSGIPAASLVVGFVGAFVSGLLACRWMISLVKRGRLLWFAVYCALVGGLSIALG